MKVSYVAAYFLCLLGVLITSKEAQAASKEKHLLYVASPGIRNLVEYGGVGILVYDIEAGYQFVKRLPTWEAPTGTKPENVRGIAANAETAKLYISTTKRVACFDLNTHKKLWEKTYVGGADRIALSPDGKVLYVPSLEGPHWHVVNAQTGEVITKIKTNSGAHNTIYALDGSRVYLAGVKSPTLFVADAKTHTIVNKIGPFHNFIRPFTINGSQTLCFVNIDDLLGFEVGDCKTGKPLYHVEVTGYQKGPIKKHSCPSHGIGLTPDEKELWLTDANNSSLHIFDATVMPPKQGKSIKLRDVPGWITFSLDGKQAYSSTGEIIDTQSKKIIATLTDEMGRAVQSEKMLEVITKDNKVIRVGDQFGIGRKPAGTSQK